jgi:signal peptidase I
MTGGNGGRNAVREGWVRTGARRVLTFAVRGRRDRGGPWGEAVLAEFDQTATASAALRWAAGGLRVVVRERYARLRTLPRLIAIATAVLAAGYLAVGIDHVPSPGMEPTLAVSSRHLVDKISFRLTGLDHGDIVQLPVPGAPGYDTERRVIGLAGDRIECRGGRVFRDGAAIDEPYLPVDVRTECDPVTVADGEIFVLGDNRDAARDSRHWGTFGKNQVEGRIVLVG